LDLTGDLPFNILMELKTLPMWLRNVHLTTTLDMGGTSTDCDLIVDGKQSLRRETVVDTLSVRSPAVDIGTVGAGGGSIAGYVGLIETPPSWT
jgi:5-oxoprolinase (ATP-hydrolysing)